MTQTILGIFDTQVNADTAVDQLEKNGFNPKNISIVMKESHAVSTENTAEKGAASGVVTGGIIGGVAGLLIGIGAIAIPGLGALLIGGPLAAAFGITGAAATTISGAATGAVAGGIIGALTGLGVPQEEAHAYQEQIQRGGILLAVQSSDEEADKARTIFEDNNAQRIRTLTA